MGSRIKAIFVSSSVCVAFLILTGSAAAQNPLRVKNSLEELAFIHIKSTGQTEWKSFRARPGQTVSINLIHNTPYEVVVTDQFRNYMETGPVNFQQIIQADPNFVLNFDGLSISTLVWQYDNRGRQITRNARIRIGGVFSYCFSIGPVEHELVPRMDRHSNRIPDEQLDIIRYE